MSKRTTKPPTHCLTFRRDGVFVGREEISRGLLIEMAEASQKKPLFADFQGERYKAVVTSRRDAANDRRIIFNSTDENPFDVKQ